MKKLKIFLFYMLILLSSENKATKTEIALKTETLKIQEDEIILGEDKQEFNAYIKNIYQKKGIVYIELDFVEIKYKNVDDRIIINKNPKIRTYIIDKVTKIHTKDCKEIRHIEIMKQKENILKYKSIIVIGGSQNGKLTYINFGCYG